MTEQLPKPENQKPNVPFRTELVNISRLKVEHLYISDISIQEKTSDIGERLIACKHPNKK